MDELRFHSVLAEQAAELEATMNAASEHGRTEWALRRPHFERCCQVELGWRLHRVLAVSGKAYEVALDAKEPGYGLPDFAIRGATGRLLGLAEMKGAFASSTHFGDSWKPRKLVPGRDLDVARFERWGGGGNKGMRADCQRLRQASDGGIQTAVVVLAMSAAADAARDGCKTIDEFQAVLTRIMGRAASMRVEEPKANSATRRHENDAVRILVFRLA